MGQFRTLATRQGDSFDHLVGGDQQGWRNGQPKGLGGLQVDDELEFRRLFDGQVGRARALGNAIHILGNPPERGDDVRSVGKQTTHVDKFALAERRRQLVAQRKFGEMLSVVEEYRRTHDEQRAAIVSGLAQGLLVIVGLRAQLDAGELQLQRRRGALRGLPLPPGGAIPEHDYIWTSGNRFLYQLQPLHGQVDLLEEQPGDIASRSRKAGDEAERQRIIIDGDDNDWSHPAGLQGSARDKFVAAGYDNVDLTEQNVRQWRETLGSLVAKQEGGGVTTLIVSKGKLVDIAKECGVKGPIGKIIDNMARKRCRLLRPVTALPGLFRPRHEYSLGHDALAIALFRWAEAHEAIIETKRESRARMRRLQLAGLIVWVIFCLAIFQLISQRAGTFATLLTFAQADQASYGQRLMLLSASLDQATGPIRLFLDYDKPLSALRETLERAPVDGDEGEAVGISDDGARLALLNGERASVIPIDPAATLNRDKHNEFKLPSEVTSSQREEGGVPSNLPITPTIGFVQGVTGPVVYKGGTLYYWVNRKSHSVSLSKLLPKLLLDSPLPQGIDISGGVIRVWLWRIGATDMDYVLIRAEGGRSEDDVFVSSAPMKVSWRSTFSFFPVGSLRSPEAAYIEREPNREKPGSDKILVKRISFSSSSTELLGTIQNTPAEEGQRDGRRHEEIFVRSLAFPVNAGGIATRSERDKFEYFSGEGAESITFQILSAMQSDPQRPAFFSLRPLLAAQQSVSSPKSWRFAWLGQNGIFVMESEGGDQRARPVGRPPLIAGEFGIENARALTFNPSGNVLTLIIQRGFREKVKYRMYDLTDGRRAAISAMNAVSLQREACRVARTERVARSSSDTWSFFKTLSCD